MRPLPSVTDGARAQDKDCAAPARRGARQCLLSLRRAATRPRSKRPSTRPRMSSASICINQRIGGVAIEPRGAIALPPAGADKLTLYSSTQVPHHIRRQVAEQLGLQRSEAPRDLARCRRRLRLQGQALSGRIGPALGGAQAQASGAMGRDPQRELPVGLSGARSHHPCRARARHGRQVSRAPRQHHRQCRRLCLDLRRRDPERDLFGACSPACTRRPRSPSNAPASSPTRCRPTPIAAPAGRRPATCWSGSPIARREALGIDRAEIRRRNLIPVEAMPYQTPIGPTYDCGDFPQVFARVTRDRRLSRASPDAPQGVAQERTAARHRHRLLCRILRRRAVALCRRRSARASASTNRPRSRWSRTAACARARHA